MLNRFSAALALGVAVLFVASGCGSSPSEVSGKVTFDNQPLEKGEIIFEPIDGKGTPSSGKITSGYYSVYVAPGPKKVRINASKPGTKVDPVMGTAPLESMIPKEYNVESKLTHEVKSGKQEGVNFDLKSKP